MSKIGRVVEFSGSRGRLQKMEAWNQQLVAENDELTQRYEDLKRKNQFLTKQISQLKYRVFFLEQPLTHQQLHHHIQALKKISFHFEALQNLDYFNS